MFMGTTVRDVLGFFCFDDDQKFAIFDYGVEEQIFIGYLDECDEDMLDMEADCIDNIYGDCDYICINVDSRDEF